MKPPAETQLAAKRAVDKCSKLVRHSRLAPAEILDDPQYSSQSDIKAAASQLGEMRKLLKDDVARWMETGILTGYLSNLNEDAVLTLLSGRKEEKVRFEEGIDSPKRNVDIPTLDMSSLRVESPDDSKKRPVSRNTPTVSEIHPYEDIEIVEVSDSSACDSQVLNAVADKVLSQLKQVKPEKTRATASIPRTENVEFSKLPLNFIPSSPLSNPGTTFTKSRDAGIQTVEKRKEPNEMVDAATSFDLQKTLDEGEVSTSTSSDPSLGQIDVSRIEAKKIVSVRRDGSLANPERFSSKAEVQSPRVSDVGWRAPLQLVKIADTDISSSFGSEPIETVSANVSARSAPSKLKDFLTDVGNEDHSDEEPTVNQISQIESEISA